MNHSIRILLLGTTFICMGFSTNSHNIKGKVIFSPIKGAWLDANVTLLDTNNKTLIKTHTNELGYFQFRKIKTGIYLIRIDGNNVQTIYYDSVIVRKDTFILLDGYKECEYDNHRLDSICPICDNSDKVVKIVYGLPVSEHKSSDDSTSFWGDSTVYWGGCVRTFCDPTWYCWRDDKEF